MHSPVSTQALAHLREASGPSPVRRMSMTPAMTARGSASTPPGPVTGQTSTHLPQRVQASAIAATRAASAVSNVSVMPRSEEHTSELQSHSDLVCRLLLEKKKNLQVMGCRLACYPYDFKRMYASKLSPAERPNDSLADFYACKSRPPQVAAHQAACSERKL